jgi:hypothetical protein
MLDRYIRNSERFEHLLKGASENYVKQRQAIAHRAYGELEFADVTDNTPIETLLRFAS